MTFSERKCRFVERMQAAFCPVCRGTIELRRTTWDDPERKMTALEAFQAKHSGCLKTGVPPARPIVSVDTITPEQRKEMAWRSGMARHCNGETPVRSAA